MNRKSTQAIADRADRKRARAMQDLQRMRQAFAACTIEHMSDLAARDPRLALPALPAVAGRPAYRYAPASRHRTPAPPALRAAWLDRLALAASTPAEARAASGEGFSPVAHSRGALWLRDGTPLVTVPAAAPAGCRAAVAAAVHAWAARYAPSGYAPCPGAAPGALGESFSI